MKSIKVKRSELLSALQENREKHRTIFLEAQVGYREQAIKELDAMLAEAKAGKRIRRSVMLTEPQDQTADYDRAIRMMEMSQDELIELSETDFAQYVLDDWQWKRQFLHSNRAYSATATGLLEDEA